MLLAELRRGLSGQLLLAELRRACLGIYLARCQTELSCPVPASSITTGPLP